MPNYHLIDQHTGNQHTSNQSIARVQQWLSRMIAAFNAPDQVDQFLHCFAPEDTRFYLDHQLVQAGSVTTEQLQSLYAAGLQPALTLRHSGGQRYKHYTYCTGYVTGTITLPGQFVLPGPWRFVALVVPHSDTWQIHTFIARPAASALDPPIVKNQRQAPHLLIIRKRPSRA